MIRLRRTPPGYLFRLATGSVAILLGACHDGDRLDPYRVMEGERIYQAECVTCHGKALQGDGARPETALDASRQPWRLSRAELAAVVRQGVPDSAPDDGDEQGMPGFGQRLNERQVESVLTYIESLWPQQQVVGRSQQTWR
jgi:mono/diheme cytochrome c family protein